MCLLCRKKYNENTTEIKCCSNVTEIPFLPNLTYLDCTDSNITEIPLLPNLTILDCRHTNITEIPFLPNLTHLYCLETKITELPKIPNLTYLDCSKTNITEIPFLPNLTYLDCSNTMITELPKIHNCNMYYDDCLWLEKWYEKYGNYYDFIFLEDKIKFLQKQYQKKKWNKIHKKIPLIRDIKN